MGYGGPHAAYFACGEEHKRFIPGRIIGVSLDSNGNPALRMALQTREQHIKRGRATSNICTAQALLAVMAGMYAVYHGPEGLKEIATEISIKANSLRICLENMGLNVLNSKQFDTITIKENSEDWKNLMLENDVNLFYRKENFSISIDETTTWSDIDKLIAVFNQKLKTNVQVEKMNLVGSQMDRKDSFLKQKVFNSYHSETEMMRYVKKLENKDLSLVHAMISLGSCTMKLYAATEMEPITWPSFCNLHPFAPVEQTKGYQEIFNTLIKDLRDITGIDSV